MGPGLAGIAAESAVATIVPAQIREWQEHFPRVSDDAAFEVFLGSAGSRQKFGQAVVRTPNQAQSQSSGNRRSH